MLKQNAAFPFRFICYSLAPATLSIKQAIYPLWQKFLILLFRNTFKCTHTLPDILIIAQRHKCAMVINIFYLWLLILFKCQQQWQWAESHQIQTCWCLDVFGSAESVFNNNTSQKQFITNKTGIPVYIPAPVFNNNTSQKQFITNKTGTPAPVFNNNTSQKQFITNKTGIPALQVLFNRICTKLLTLYYYITICLMMYSSHEAGLVQYG